MIKRIWKYMLHIADHQTVNMPEGGKIIHFALQDDIPTIWVEVDPEAERVERKFRLFGTGHEFNDTGLIYIGSVTGHLGKFVWHLYEEFKTKNSKTETFSGPNTISEQYKHYYGFTEEEYEK